MPAIVTTLPSDRKSRLDRALSFVSDVRAGEGTTAVLLMVNIFLLLICYSVIKTVREPLILLGGGAEVRSYAAAGQAVLLMGFVPLYSWIASRVNRMTLIIGVTLFFVGCIELFSAGVAARVPYIGVAFFIWVGIFNISLVAQFWSFANELYRKETGDRLFPIIMVGMTAGAPLGSFVAARLFKVGLTPQLILQLSASLLLVTSMIYVAIHRREAGRAATRETTAPLSSAGGFRLVLANPYLRLIAVLVVLLNVVNTTGEYMIAKMLSAHVAELAAGNPGFNKQAFIGAFSGEYQFWVNISALLLQTLVTSRLVKHQGLRGVLLALPLIALGGYGLIAAGVGFSVIRWIKTAENATDYSIMNTARQLLWLPTSREEKYKAKQAIDTFFVRTGDVLSAAVVYTGTALLHLSPSQFAVINVVMTLVWLATAYLILRPAQPAPRLVLRPLAGVAAVVAILLLASTTHAQEVTPAPAHPIATHDASSVSAPADEARDNSRSGQLAQLRAEKARHLHEYVPDTLERRLDLVNRMMISRRAVYPYIGSVMEGGGIAAGPGVRGRFAETGTFDVHAGFSFRSVAAVEGNVLFPRLANGRVALSAHAEQLHAPTVAYFGGNASSRADRGTFKHDSTVVGGAARVQATTLVAVGGSLDWMQQNADGRALRSPATIVDPTYAKAGVFAEIDTRTSPGYTRRGGLYRVDWAAFSQVNGSAYSYRRLDAEVQQFIPVMRERFGFAVRGLATTTDTASDATVPYFMLPELGGSRMLRGYSPWRFRDRNRLLLSAEYRWPAGPFVDMAVFMDAGKVTADRADLNLRDLRTSKGVGVRIHTPSSTVTRIEVARSREGTSLIFSFSPSF